MSEDLERQFLDAITRSPDDEDARAVYADWLEGRGDPRGEYLRLELQLYKLPKRLAELAPSIDEKWLEAISRNFDVLLCNPGPSKISVIKEVREMTGLGLKDAKDVVDRASTTSPYAVAKRLDLETANRVAQRLADAGATFQIEGHIGGRPPTPPTRVRLVLQQVTGGTLKLEAIKLVREASGLGLADAKSLVERLLAGGGPEQLTDSLPPARAEWLAVQFSRVGRAIVEPI